MTWLDLHEDVGALFGELEGDVENCILEVFEARRSSTQARNNEATRMSRIAWLAFAVFLVAIEADPFEEWGVVPWE